MSFKDIYELALLLKGNAGLDATLPAVLKPASLKKVADADYLAEMTKCVFRSGFVWRVVDAKWPNFETAFASFNPRAVASFSDERLEQLSEDASIIRHRTKILATRDNAAFVWRIADEYGSFGQFLADWPVDDLVGLHLYLKKHGSRLGGHTGQYFLRFVGKDTFLFSKDVVTALVRAGVVDKEPTSQKALREVQQVMNEWRAETGLPYAHLSRILAASIDSN